MKFPLDMAEFHGISGNCSCLFPSPTPPCPAALADLTARDPRLARIVADYGPPPLWAREPGFPTLVHIILEQQVSLASAQAAFDRLLAVASPLTPERFLELDDATLKTAGFSRQKTRYGRELAARDPLRRAGSGCARRAGRSMRCAPH